MNPNNDENNLAQQNRQNEPLQTGRILRPGELQGAFRVEPVQKVQKVVHHKHTGKLLHAWHTSYVFLFFILVFVASFLLFSLSQVSRAADQVDSGSVTLSGTYFGVAPTTAAVIESPVSGKKAENRVIAVSGTCQAGYIVEINRDGALAGTIICSTPGDFSIQITLVKGKNELVARTKNGANQYGPDSNIVNVTYTEKESRYVVDPNTGSGSADSDAINTSQSPALLIYANPVQSGVEPGIDFDLKYEIDGGFPPYALTINWGDNSENTLKPHNKSGNFSAKHEYENAGQYSVILTVTDSRGDEAIIQTIVIVNGEPEQSNIVSSVLQPGSTQDCATLGSSSTDSVTCIIIERINAVWPAIIIASLMTFSFWVGEQFVFWRLKRSQNHS